MYVFQDQPEDLSAIDSCEYIWYGHFELYYIGHPQQFF